MPITPPHLASLHVDTLLTNISVAYAQSAAGFICDRFAPVVPVDKQSDVYPVWNKGDMLRSDAQERAVGGEAATKGFNVSTTQYYAKWYALKKFIGDVTSRGADAAFRLDQTTVLALTQDLLIKRDQIWAAAMFTTGVWATNYTGVASDSPSTNEFERWDRAGSTPIVNIRALSSVVQTLTGRDPNTLVLGRNVYNTLIDHVDVIDRIKYVRIAGPQAVYAELAQLLGVERVMVASAIQNTAAEGATASYSQIVNPNAALLAYVTSSPSLEEPSAAYTFSWSEFDMVKNGGGATYQYRDEPRRGKWIETEMFFVPKIVAADAGAFVTTLVGS